MQADQHPSQPLDYAAPPAQTMRRPLPAPRPPAAALPLLLLAIAAAARPAAAQHPEPTLLAVKIGCVAPGQKDSTPTEKTVLDTWCGAGYTSCKQGSDGGVERVCTIDGVDYEVNWRAPRDDNKLEYFFKLNGQEVTGLDASWVRAVLVKAAPGWCVYTPDKGALGDSYVPLYPSPPAQFSVPYFASDPSKYPGLSHLTLCTGPPPYTIAVDGKGTYNKKYSW
jgi:hypothetical protein